MDTLPQVFFSYANAPETLLDIQSLAIALERAGIDVWQDRRRLVAGRDFEDEIIARVRASAAVVFFATPLAFGSDWVLREVREASVSGLPIIPCFLTRSAMSPAFAPFISSKTYLEFFRYARKDWPRALLWTLHLNGVPFSWPADLARELPPIETDIDAIQPPYSHLRGASEREIAELIGRMSAAIELNGRWGFGHLNLGLVYLHLGDRERAVNALRAAVKYLPRIADAYYFLALGLLAFLPLRRARQPWLGEAEVALSVARGLDPTRAIFAVLDELISIEHYQANAFRRPGAKQSPPLQELVQAARRQPAQAEELDRLAATIPIRNRRTAAFLGRVTGG